MTFGKWVHEKTGTGLERLKSGTGLDNLEKPLPPNELATTSLSHINDCGWGWVSSRFFSADHCGDRLGVQCRFRKVL